MAHVAGSPPPHPLVAMPPHAWSTEAQRSTSQTHRLSLPSYPTSSSMLPQHSWNSTLQNTNLSHLQPSLSADHTPPTDRTDQLNADTIFGDLLNLRIANDTSMETTSMQTHPALQNPHIPAQVAPHPAVLRQDLLHHSDLDSDHLDAADHFDHPEQSLEHFPSQLSSLPYLQHNLQQHRHDTSVSGPLSVSHSASFGPHGPFTSTPLVNRRHSSQAGLYRSSSVSDQSARTPTSSRSHGPAVPAHSGPRIKNDLYKTEICRSFAENAGFCKYGSKCQFAHGEEELRPVRRHPRYKTKLCRNFVNNGSCPYDTRCRFIHANDLRFVSSQAVSGLHLASVPATSGSCIDEHARYDNASITGEDYSEHLRRLLTMPPGSSATGMSASEEPSIPLSSHSSPPAEVNTRHSSLEAPRENFSDQMAYRGPPGKQGNHMVPADHAYRASANVFSDYPENAFSQPYVPLVGGNSEISPGSSAAPDDNAARAIGALQKVSVSESAKTREAFRPHQDPSTTEVLKTEADTLCAAQQEKTGDISVHDSDILRGNVESTESSKKVPPPKGARGRLPVFRNITSDGDSV